MVSVSGDSDEKLKLYKCVRRLTIDTESGPKLVKNYFFCTKCGSVKYFDTTNYYNELIRHYQTDCAPHQIGRGKMLDHFVEIKIINIFYLFWSFFRQDCNNKAKSFGSYTFNDENW